MTSRIFFSYSHQDEGMRDRLEKHLAPLKRSGAIENFHDRRIEAGRHVDHSISREIENANIILFLVSADFLSSDYCNDIEVEHALERHGRDETVVIPVILRPCDWQSSNFGRLIAAPKDGRPITKWPNEDDAMLNVAEMIKACLPKITKTHLSSDERPKKEIVAEPAIRSSNLRLSKQFTEKDKDTFLHDAFDYMRKFFKNSLEELENRNEKIETTYREVDASRFWATIYREGKKIAAGTYFLGGWGHGVSQICYVNGESTQDNTMNEALSVECDDQMMFLKPLGFMLGGRSDDATMTCEGASEFYWECLIEPLQR